MGEWRYTSTILDLGTSGGEWSASRLCRFNPGERALGTNWMGGWVDPRTGLDAVKRKILYCWESNQDRPQPVARRYTDS
jgi:hypothetical protein